LNVLSIYDIFLHGSCEILIAKEGLDLSKENIVVNANLFDTDTNQPKGGIWLSIYVSQAMMTAFLSNKRPAQGVHTDISGFVGLTTKGPVSGAPQPVFSYSDFVYKYGGPVSNEALSAYGYLAYAISQFFANGGSQCYVARVTPEDAGVAVNNTNPALKIAAKNPGAWSNGIRIHITPSHKVKTQILDIVSERRYLIKKSAGIHVGDIMALTQDGGQVLYNRVTQIQDHVLEFETPFPSEVTDKNLLPSKILYSAQFNMTIQYENLTETYAYLDFNVNSPNYAEKILAQSDLIIITQIKKGGGIIAPFAAIANEAADHVSISLHGGSDGTPSGIGAAVFIGQDHGAGKRTGIQAFLENDQVSLMAVPGVTDPEVQAALVHHCETLGNRVALLDLPEKTTRAEDVLARRDMFDSGYAAIYHPWITVMDLNRKQEISVPPSGSAAGVFARSDARHGVQKAPANEIVMGCVGVAYPYSRGEQDILNAAGVNLIRRFSEQGIRIWGARTCSHQPDWQYVHICRLFIYLRESIKRMTRWVIFEPNNEMLWLKVQRSIDVFLTHLWRNGVFSGGSPAEAFYVKVGKETMTPEDIAQGRLICSIGVAPVKPSEFITFSKNLLSLEP
jgi:phage tail sheath protein FI